MPSDQVADRLLRPGDPLADPRPRQQEASARQGRDVLRYGGAVTGPAPVRDSPQSRPPVSWSGSGLLVVATIP